MLTIIYHNQVSCSGGNFACQDGYKIRLQANPNTPVGPLVARH